jgi:hypothetical protein
LKNRATIADALDLVFTPRFLDEHSREAESAVRLALLTGAAIEQVSGRAAQLLDARAASARDSDTRPPPRGRNVVTTPQ